MNPRRHQLMPMGRLIRRSGSRKGVCSTDSASSPSPGTPEAGSDEGLRRSYRRAAGNDKVIRQNCRAARAFTLAEMLVVIAIIAVLIALLLPGIVTARARTNNVICANNVRQICQALINYASDYKGALPLNVQIAPSKCWSDGERIGRYLRSGTTNAAGEMRSPILICPDDPSALRSYSMNAWASSMVEQLLTQSGNGVLWKQSVRRASNMILVTETLSRFGAAATGFTSPQIIPSYSSTPGRWFGAGGGLPLPLWAGRFGYVRCELAYYRHRLPGIRLPITTPVGRVNIGYADGHVALKSNDDLANAATGLSTLDSWWSPMDQELNH